MQKEVRPGLAIGIVVALLILLVGLYVWHPWANGVIRPAPPISRADRLKMRQEMGAERMEAAQHRQQRSAQ